MVFDGTPEKFVSVVKTNAKKIGIVCYEINFGRDVYTPDQIWPTKAHDPYHCGVRIWHANTPNESGQKNANAGCTIEATTNKNGTSKLTIREPQGEIKIAQAQFLQLFREIKKEQWIDDYDALLDFLRANGCNVEDEIEPKSSASPTESEPRESVVQPPQRGRKSRPENIEAIIFGNVAVWAKRTGYYKNLDEALEKVFATEVGIGSARAWANYRRDGLECDGNKIERWVGKSMEELHEMATSKKLAEWIQGNRKNIGKISEK